MNNNPPHLPEKKENKELKDALLRIRFFLIVVFLAIISGVSGALFSLGWIWPYAAEGDTWALSQVKTVTRKQLETKVWQDLSSRILQVYEEKNNYYGSWYLDEKDFISDGIVLTTDGWLAIYNPDYKGNALNWVVFSEIEKKFYSLEKAIYDNKTGFVYAKLGLEEGQDSRFKVITFSDENDFSNKEIFVRKNENWIYNLTTYLKFKNLEYYLDTEPIIFYELSSIKDAGLSAVDSQGRLVGVVSQTGDLIPFTYINKVLPKVLNEEKIVYPSLGIKGWFSEEKPIFNENNELVKGFLVRSIVNVNTKLRAGDIILKIDGVEISSENIWDLLIGKDEVEVQLLRQGEEQKIITSVLKI